MHSNFDTWHKCSPFEKKIILILWYATVTPPPLFHVRANLWRPQKGDFSMSPLIPAALLNKMITCRVKTALKYIPYKYCGLLLNLTGMPKSLLNYCNKINNIKYFLRSRDWETILLLQHCSTAPEIGRNKISVMFFICFTTFFLNKVLIVFHTDKRNQSSMILYLGSMAKFVKKI